MSNGRRSRRAKQRNGETSGDTTLTDVIRTALERGHPLGLLTVASMVIHVAKPEMLGRRDTSDLDGVLAGLIGVRNRETTALLAVISELLVDDPTPRLRCRQELAERAEHLPRWIIDLPQVEAYRAVRRTHVLGDVDELVIGFRLNGQHELTVGVLIDHNMLSSVADAAVVPDSIDEALARAAESSSDTDVVEMRLADARVWIADALTGPTLVRETVSWPLYRALVEWVLGRLPEGGEHRSPAGDLEMAEELCDRFFTTSSGAPFISSSHRELLLELLETGTGDPLRWSTARVEQAIGGTPYCDGSIPLEIALDAPDLLRAYIPYAHVQSGIRDELTSRAVAMVDALRTSYKREVLKQAKRLDFDAV